MAERTALLAAGGTGGHLFPAEALAHELIARGWEVHLATDDRANRFAGNFPAAEVHTVASATIGGRNPIALARAFWTLWRGARQSSAIIARIRPSVVVGFGGYPTLPPLWAATRRGVPSVIHEQNAVMGRANKALAPRVSAIAGGFLPPGGGRFADKTIVTGNPVRPAVLAAAASAVAPNPEVFHLLVFGGSQGAQFFSEAIPAAARLLDASDRGRLRVVQQARKEDESAVKAAYAELGIPAEVSPFFGDMADRIARADLVIARSGASTVSEIAVIGRPSILVPYPYALDHDQAANAAALKAADGAEVHAQASLSPARLAGLIGRLIHDPEARQRMAAGARKAGRPDAARLLADLVEATSRGTRIEDFRKGITA